MPLFIFVFVITFGEQHFTLRGYFPQVNAAGEVLRTAKGDTLFKRVPGFHFTNQSGHTITQQQLTQGDGVYVVQFLEKECADSCKIVSTQLMRVQEAFRKNPQVKLASIMVAAAADTVQMLQHIAAQYSADPKKWFFLAGPRAEVYQLASQGFHLPVGEQQNIASHKVWLVDKEGHVRGIYKGAKVTDIDRLNMEINVLLDEYSKSK
ncbi:SCO family protein [Pontibacter liquoris]|uniref:SCO family protein n=1 Tax=Pontibacter liquoris TaxID=2905677 RepID=UPI001FA7ED28